MTAQTPPPQIPPRRLSILRFLLFFGCIANAVSLWAAGPGTSAASFLKLGFGARPIGMGEAFVALADDASALYYNPAGLAFPPLLGDPTLRRPWELLISHSLHVQDIRVSQLGVVRKPFGVSLTYLSLDGIEGRTAETAQPESTFGSSDLSLGLSYGRKVGSVGVGMTGKFIQEKIASYSSETFALDLGALYHLRRFPLSLGGSLNNLGGRIRFIEQSAPLPTTLRLGVMAGMTARFPAALSVQADIPRDADPLYRLGFEYAGFGPFSLRTGYMAVPREQKDAVLGRALGSSSSGLSELFGFFMGVGFRFRQGSIDYALVPYGELGSAHRFSMGVRF